MPLARRGGQIMSSTSAETINSAQHPAPQEVVYRGQIVRVQVPQYYYSVCDEDFQTLEKLAVSRGGTSIEIPPPNAEQYYPSKSPSSNRQLSITVNGSCLDRIRQSGGGMGSVMYHHDDVVNKGVVLAKKHSSSSQRNASRLARCRSEPDLLLDGAELALTNNCVRGYNGNSRSTDKLNSVDHWQAHNEYYCFPHSMSNPRGTPRTVVLRKDGGTFGFVLCGPKSRYENAAGLSFTPTARYPALQYLDSVEPGSVAEKAGLASGDFLLEINGQDVVSASHSHTVRLVKEAGDAVYLKVISPLVNEFDNHCRQTNRKIESGCSRHSLSSSSSGGRDRLDSSGRVSKTVPTLCCSVQPRDKDLTCRSSSDLGTSPSRRSPAASTQLPDVDDLDHESYRQTISSVTSPESNFSSLRQLLSQQSHHLLQPHITEVETSSLEKINVDADVSDDGKKSGSDDSTMPLLSVDDKSTTSQLHHTAAESDKINASLLIDAHQHSEQRNQPETSVRSTKKQPEAVSADANRHGLNAKQAACNKETSANLQSAAAKHRALVGKLMESLRKRQRGELSLQPADDAEHSAANGTSGRRAITSVVYPAVGSNGTRATKARETAAACKQESAVVNDQRSKPLVECTVQGTTTTTTVTTTATSPAEADDKAILIATSPEECGGQSPSNSSSQTTPSIFVSSSEAASTGNSTLTSSSTTSSQKRSAPPPPPPIRGVSLPENRHLEQLLSSIFAEAKLNERKFATKPPATLSSRSIPDLSSSAIDVPPPPPPLHNGGVGAIAFGSQPSESVAPEQSKSPSHRPARLSLPVSELLPSSDTQPFDYRAASSPNSQNGNMTSSSLPVDSNQIKTPMVDTAAIEALLDRRKQMMTLTVKPSTAPVASPTILPLSVGSDATSPTSPNFPKSHKRKAPSPPRSSSAISGEVETRPSSALLTPLRCAVSPHPEPFANSPTRDCYSSCTDNEHNFSISSADPLLTAVPKFRRPAPEVPVPTVPGRSVSSNSKPDTLSTLLPSSAQSHSNFAAGNKTAGGRREKHQSGNGKLGAPLTKFESSDAEVNFIKIAEMARQDYVRRKAAARIAAAAASQLRRAAKRDEDGAINSETTALEKRNDDEQQQTDCTGRFRRVLEAEVASDCFNRSAAKANVKLARGKNVALTRITKQGTLRNDVTAIGARSLSSTSSGSAPDGLNRVPSTERLTASSDVLSSFTDALTLSPPPGFD